MEEFAAAFGGASYSAYWRDQLFLKLFVRKKCWGEKAFIAAFWEYLWAGEMEQLRNEMKIIKLAVLDKGRDGLYSA